MNTDTDKAQKHILDLLDAAQFAAALLNKIPAFGDTIGKNVSKAQLGVARSKLCMALSALALEEKKRYVIAQGP